MEMRTEGDKFIVNHHEEVSGVLKKNYEDRLDPRNGFSKDRSQRHIARVPMTVWFGWIKDHPELMKGDLKLREKTLINLLKKEENEIFLTVKGGI